MKMKSLLAPQGLEMWVRESSCLLMEHASGKLALLNVAGMLTFVGAFIALNYHVLGITEYLLVTSASLLLHGVSISLGHLGDPFELERRRKCYFLNSKFNPQ